MTSVLTASVARAPLVTGELPPNTTISQGLEIEPRYSLPFIPEGTRFEGGFICRANRGLMRVGSYVRAAEVFTLDDCPRLREIEEGLAVKGDLNLRNCPALERIGDDLYVGGNLDLDGCSPTIRLPSRGVVKCDLILPKRFDTDRLAPGFTAGRVLMVV